MGYPLTEAPDFLSAEVWQAVFMEAPTPQALVDPATSRLRLVRINEAFLRLTALPRAAAEGRGLNEVLRGAAGQQVRRAIESAVSHGEPARLRIAHAPVGQVVRLAVEARRIEGDNGSLVLLSLVKLKQQLPLAELGEAGVLAELSSLSRGMVYIRDIASGHFRFGPHPLAKRMALPGGGQLLAETAERLHPDDLARFREHTARLAAASDSEVVRSTFRLKGPDGDWIWVDLRARVFTRDREGAVRQIIGVATDVTESHTHAEALDRAAAALVHAELNERRRIGRELHDSTAQLLVGARLSLAALERELTPDAPTAALDEVRGLILDAQREIRNLAYVLHPPGLYDQGLQTTLRHFAAGFARRTGLPVLVSVRSGRDRLPFTVEMALFRITQEALMNVYRHAQANQAWVRLARRRGEVVLEIEDDGVGLPDADLDKPPTGVGIEGMQARMVQLGGRFELARGGAGGLRVRATVPQGPRPGV